MSHRLARNSNTKYHLSITNIELKKVQIVSVADWRFVGWNCCCRGSVMHESYGWAVDGWTFNRPEQRRAIQESLVTTRSELR